MRVTKLYALFNTKTGKYLKQYSTNEETDDYRAAHLSVTKASAEFFREKHLMKDENGVGIFTTNYIVAEISCSVKSLDFE